MGWETDVSKLLADKLGKPVEILSSSRVGGGSINLCNRIETNEGLFFVKKNDASRFPEMFQKEALGQEILS